MWFLLLFISCTIVQSCVQSPFTPEPTLKNQETVSTDITYCNILVFNGGDSVMNQATFVVTNGATITVLNNIDSVSIRSLVITGDGNPNNSFRLNGNYSDFDYFDSEVDVYFDGNSPQHMNGGRIGFKGAVVKELNELVLTSTANIFFKKYVAVATGSLVLTAKEIEVEGSYFSVEGDLSISASLKISNVNNPFHLNATGAVTFAQTLIQPTATQPLFITSSSIEFPSGGATVQGTLTLNAPFINISSFGFEVVQGDLILDGDVTFSTQSSQSLNAKSVIVTGIITKANAGTLTIGKTGSTNPSSATVSDIMFPLGTLEIPWSIMISGHVKVDRFNTLSSSGHVSIAGNMTLQASSLESTIHSTVTFSGTQQKLMIVGPGSVIFMQSVAFDNELEICSQDNFLVRTPQRRFQQGIEGGNILILTSVNVNVLGDVNIVDTFRMTSGGSLTLESPLATVKATSLYLSAPLVFQNGGFIAPHQNAGQSGIFHSSGTITAQSISIMGVALDGTKWDMITIHSLITNVGDVYVESNNITTVTQEIIGMTNVLISCVSSCKFPGQKIQSTTGSLTVISRNGSISSGALVQSSSGLTTLSAHGTTSVTTLTSLGIMITANNIVAEALSSLGQSANFVFVGSAQLGTVTSAGDINISGTLNNSVLNVTGQIRTTNGGSLTLYSKVATLTSLDLQGNFEAHIYEKLLFSGPITLPGGEAKVYGSNASTVHVTFFSANLFSNGIFVQADFLSIGSFEAGTQVTFLTTNTIITGAVTVTQGSDVILVSDGRIVGSDGTMSAILCSVHVEAVNIDLRFSTLTIGHGDFIGVDSTEIDNLEGSGDVMVNGGLMLVVGTILTEGRLDIVASEFRVNGDLGGSNCQGIQLPATEVLLEKGGPQIIDAGMGELIFLSPISKGDNNLFLSGSRIILPDTVIVAGMLSITTPFLVSNSSIKSLNGAVDIKTTQGFIHGDITGAGIFLAGYPVNSIGAITFPSSIMVTFDAGSGILRTNGADISKTSGGNLLCMGIGFELGALTVSDSLTISFTSAGDRNIQIFENIIVGNELVLHAGSTILLKNFPYDSTKDHLISAPTINYISLNKEGAGSVTLEGSLITLSEIFVQQGDFVMRSSIQNPQFSFSGSLLTAANNNVDIPYSLDTSVGPSSKRIVGSSILLGGVIGGISTIQLEGGITTISGYVNVESFTCRSTEVFLSDNIQTIGDMVFQKTIGDMDSTLHLTSPTSQYMMGARIDGVHIVKSLGDLHIVGTTTVSLKGTVQIAGNLSVESPMITLSNDVTISSDGVFDGPVQIQEYINLPTSAIVIASSNGELVFVGNVNIQISTLTLQSGSQITLGADATGVDTELIVRSPLYLEGTNILMSSINLQDEVRFNNNGAISVQSNGPISFHGPVIGDQTPVTINNLEPLSNISFYQNVDMMNSVLQLQGTPVMAKGNLASMSMITSFKAVDLNGCGQQSVSAIKVESGDLKKINGDLHLTGKLTLTNGNLAVSGNLISSDIQLNVGNITVGGDANLAGSVVLKHSSTQYVSSGMILEIQDLTKEAVNVYLNSQSIILTGLSQVIKVGAGVARYCGSLDCSQCGSCSDCVTAIEGTPGGGTSLPSSSCSIFSTAPMNDSSCSIVTMSPTMSPTQGPTMSPTTISIGSTMSPTSSGGGSQTSGPTSVGVSPTSSSIVVATNSSTICQPGTMGCACMTGSQCSENLMCSIKDLCQITVPTTASPTTSGADLGTKLSIISVIAMTILVFLL